MALYETEACQSAVLAVALTGSNLPWSEAINNYVCELKKIGRYLCICFSVFI